MSVSSKITGDLNSVFLRTPDLWQPLRFYRAVFIVHCLADLFRFELNAVREGSHLHIKFRDETARGRSIKYALRSALDRTQARVSKRVRVEVAVQ